MALYRKLIEGENRKVIGAMDALQGEAAASGLSDSDLDSLLKEENPS